MAEPVARYSIRYSILIPSDFLILNLANKEQDIRRQA